MTRRQVEVYLKSGGEPLQRLRAAVEGDEFFWELLETPLMLWVAMLSYRNAPYTFTQNASLDQRRRQLFRYFTDTMFRRKEG